MCLSQSDSLTWRMWHTRARARMHAEYLLPHETCFATFAAAVAIRLTLLSSCLPWTGLPAATG